MKNAETYLTCVCGAIVTEANIQTHVEECSKEDFIKQCMSLKITKHPKRNKKQSRKKRHVCAKCVRCEKPMIKDEGTLITFYPSSDRSFVTCCTYSCTSDGCDTQGDPLCETCNLPLDFHKSCSRSEEIINCVQNIEDGRSNCRGTQSKRRQEQAMTEEFLNTISEEEDDGPCLGESHVHEHSVIYNDVRSRTSTPCSQFHIALLPNYRDRSKEKSNCRNYSLLLQILDRNSSTIDGARFSSSSNTVEVGTQVRILGIYPDEIVQLLSDDSYSVPDFDPAAEIAFQKHLRTLVPCRYCSRTFSPDRIIKHESCCIERPKSRECVTPPNREIKRE